MGISPEERSRLRDQLLRFMADCDSGKIKMPDLPPAELDVPRGLNLSLLEWDPKVQDG